MLLDKLTDVKGTVLTTADLVRAVAAVVQEVADRMLWHAEVVVAFVVGRGTQERLWNKSHSCLRVETRLL